LSTQKRFSNFDEWLQALPEFIRKSLLMEFKAYPKALFLYDLVWFDCEILMKDARGKALTTQLIHSADSIGANIEEGYGRGFGPDYARFLIIALGSARETQGRYVRARHHESTTTSESQSQKERNEVKRKSQFAIRKLQI